MGKVWTKGIHNKTKTKYDENGYDIFGYNKSGYDKDEFDKLGFNKKGINKTTGTIFNIDGYNKDGFDINGNKKIENLSPLKVSFSSVSKENTENKNISLKEQTENKNHSENKSILIYDEKGFDQYGYNRIGYDKNGYDREGFDTEGYNIRGFSRHKIFKYTQTRYDRNGYDYDGYNEKGFNREGYNRKGIKEEEIEKNDILIEIKDKILDLKNEEVSEKSTNSEIVRENTSKNKIKENNISIENKVPVSKEKSLKTYITSIRKPAETRLKSSFKMKEINVEQTEIISSVKTRRGHNEFKNNLLAVETCCKICGLSNINLLVASHIKPWNKSNDEEKLDYNNGFLLCPNHDSLFDKGFISFSDNGSILISSILSKKDLILLNINENTKIKLNDKNKFYLKYHRENVFKK